MTVPSNSRANVHELPEDCRTSIMNLTNRHLPSQSGERRHAKLGKKRCRDPQAEYKETIFVAVNTDGLIFGNQFEQK